MKNCRIYLIVWFVILATAFSASAQKKNVDAAWRLVGKTESVNDARKLVKEAMAHQQTARQSRTYFVAAMIELRSYEADVRKREINPNDASVKDDAMSQKLLDSYRYFTKAMALDSLPDKKGRVKPKYTKEIIELLDSHSYGLYRAGALSYVAGKYYPQAYDGLMAAANLASLPAMERSRKLMPDSVRANAYFFAGLSAYGGGQPRKALDALGKAENCGMKSDTLYLYTMAIWEQMARDSVSLHAEAQDSLMAVAGRAYGIHGIKVPDFLSRLTQLYIAENKTDSILAILDRELERSPEAWLPRGLRGWVYESRGDIEAAIFDYKLAAEHPDMSAKMLMRGAHALYRTAHAGKESIKGNRKQRRRMAEELIENYLVPATKMAVRAQERTSDPKDLALIKNIIDAIDYDMSLLK